ncbi:helix-turn-helix transcriptional regulator [Paenibacillus radicis (ex Xue et al. 2023)]|uniref:AraC family transcriptional regulator n=1 Tax=Paenibacillus radicis (ex Xue et al. 2023) TaxID=2972489 RepID=A0ABT1YGC6_9BACL|nr:AraC family transcriptional regulator [Paenibacillus radicis (ex Xue et al. 2023)]MCR8632254.1 AraC family transcriptional regulator [Paenibacillus radicis (ex Xue et al. 2023)]
MKEYAYEYAERLYHTPTEWEHNGGLWAIRAGQNLAKPNYAVGPRVIECYSLHFVLSGSLALAHGGQTVHLDKGDVFCLYPNIMYNYWIHPLPRSDEALRMCWLALDGPQIEALLERVGFMPQHPYLRKRMNSECEGTVKDLIYLMRDPRGQEELLLQAKLYHLFSLLDRSQSQGSTDEAKDGWLQRSLQYMQTHYMEGISVAKVVEFASVHRSHFYSEFTRRVGTSPQQFLTKLRMERAAEMLESESFSITEIALSLGYPDLFSFSRSFSNFYGISPSRYRSNQKNQKHDEGSAQFL